MYLRISFKSQMLGRGVGVHAFLPFHDGYEDAQAPYPTLYFLPGYSANAEELATLLPLRRFSAEYGVAVIIPDGENSFYTDHPERCALFSSYVGDELVRVTALPVHPAGGYLDRRHLHGWLWRMHQRASLARHVFQNRDVLARHRCDRPLERAGRLVAQPALFRLDGR